MVSSSEEEKHPVARTLCSGSCTHAWGKHWARKRLLIHCDNQAVVHVWHTGTTKRRSLMALVRALFFIAASQNFTVVLQHIPGVNNSITDALSRFQFYRFHRLATAADTDPTPTPLIKTTTRGINYSTSKRWASLHPPSRPTGLGYITMSGSVGSTTVLHGEPPNSPSNTTAFMPTKHSHMPLFKCTWRGLDISTCSWDTATLWQIDPSWPTSARVSNTTREPQAE